MRRCEKKRTVSQHVPRTQISELKVHCRCASPYSTACVHCLLPGDGFSIRVHVVPQPSSCVATNADDPSLCLPLYDDGDTGMGLSSPPEEDGSRQEQELQTSALGFSQGMLSQPMSRRVPLPW